MAQSQRCPFCVALSDTVGREKLRERLQPTRPAAHGNVIGRCVSQLAETWLGSHRRVEFEAKVVKSEQRRVLISCLVEAGQYKKTGLFMPETWFHHKAERCAQLAKDAANPTQRSLLQEGE
jgi:hypothetical protein